MGLIRNLVLYFTANPGRLRELEALREKERYPDGERLEELRAWLFRHAGGA